MAKKSSDGILYLVLAIATAALIAWVWSKSSKTAILANLKANAAAGSAGIAVASAPVSDVLIAPPDMSTILSNSAPL